MLGVIGPQHRCEEDGNENRADRTVDGEHSAKLDGGSERVVSYLTEALVALGHDVTLFASGQSITSAKLVPCCAQPLRLNPAVRDIIPYYMLFWTRFAAWRRSSTSCISTSTSSIFRSSTKIARRTVTTLHGRQDLPDLTISIAVFPTCRWCRSRTRSARRSPTQTMSAPSITACRETSRRRCIRAAAISRSSGAYRRRSVSTGRSRSPVPWACR